MDFTGIIAVILGFGLMVFGIGLDSIKNFIHIQSFIITIGGTLACVLASYPFSMLKHIPSHLKIVCTKNKYHPAKYIDTIIEFASEARKQGLLVLEEKANELEDPFLKNGVMMIVDAVEETKVRQVLEGELYYLSERHEAQAHIYQRAATYAPAFGMIGTLIGLINMLKSLNLDSGGSSQIGEGMSVALLTTLYGSVFANLILAPIANKLNARHAEEMLCKEIIVEGIVSIQSGENPKQIREKLVSYLEHKQRLLQEEESEGTSKKPGKREPKRKRT